MKTSEWTQLGHRIVVDIGPKGLIVLTCQSQTILLGSNQAAQRQPWAMSQLVLFLGTPQGAAHKLLAHWLAFYDDPQLTEQALGMFRQAFLSVSEAPEVEPGKAPGPQGPLN